MRILIREYNSKINIRITLKTKMKTFILGKIIL